MLKPIKARVKSNTPFDFDLSRKYTSPAFLDKMSPEPMTNLYAFYEMKTWAFVS